MVDDRFALHDIPDAGNEVLARRDYAALYHVFEHARGQGGEPRRAFCDRAERNARFFGGLFHIVRLFALHVCGGSFVAFALRILLELVYRLNVHGDGQLGVQFQNLRQQLIRKLRRHDLQICSLQNGLEVS